MALSDAGTLWYQSATRGELHRLLLDGDSQAALDPESVRRLIANLAHRDADRRDQASDELAALGEPVRPYLEQALADPFDGEQEYRLQRLLSAMEPRGSPATKVDSLQVNKVRQILHDERGRVYIVAEEISQQGQAPREGSVIVEGENARFLGRPLPGMVHALTASQGQFPTCAGDDRTWLPSSGMAELARLLDLTTGELLDQLPRPDAVGPWAVDASGRVFAATSGPAKRMMVYTPGVAAGEPPLPMVSVSLAANECAVADDGAFWAIRTDGGLSRFDGREWHGLMSDPPRDVFNSFRWDRITGMFPGKDGVMLVVYYRKALLFQGERHIASGELPDVLQQQSELIARAYGPGGEPSAWEAARDRIAVAADHGGRIWLTWNGQLSVLIGGQWQDAQSAMQQAGSRYGSAATVAWVGDGSRVYVSDHHLRHDGGCSLLGEWSEDRLRFTAAPHVIPRSLDTALYVRDGQWKL